MRDQWVTRVSGKNLTSGKRGRHGALMLKVRECTELERRFAMAFVGEANGDASAAYRLSYTVDGSKENTIRSAATKVLQRPAVQRFIASLRRRVADKFEITQLDILRHWWGIATADPGELINAERRCCRFCHGVNFEYQWIDAKEWAETMARELAAAEREKREPNIPSDAGGYGFDHTYSPVEACPQCRGDGSIFVQIADTRTLSPAGKLLYRGIKQTNHGIQVLMADQDAALVNIAKALGVFGDEAGKAGNSTTFNFNFSGKTTAAEATKLYRALMG